MAGETLFYCSKCDAHLEEAQVDSVGTTHIICPNCRHVSRTKNSPFSYKNTFGKVYTLFEYYFSLSSFIIFILLGFFLKYLKSNFLFLEGIWLLITLLLTILYRTFVMVNDIAKVETKQKQVEKELNITPK